MKKVQSQFATPVQSPGFLLWQVTHIWQRKINAVLQAYDLTHLQFVLLAHVWWLTQKGESITQVQLAEQVKVQVMLVSQVVRVLERKCYIKRVQSSLDTRAKCIETTAEGKQQLQRALPAVEKVDREFFARGKEHKQSFILFLQRLVEK